MSEWLKQFPQRWTGDRRAVLVTGDVLDVLRSLSPGSVDLFITSPPYNSSTSCDPTKRATRYGDTWKWKRALNNGLGNGYGSHTDRMNDGDYQSWQRNVLSEMWRVLPDDGAIFYNHKTKHRKNVLQLQPLEMAADGMILRQIIIWWKSGGLCHQQGYFLPTTEWIVVWAKPSFRLLSKKHAGIGDVWRIHQQCDGKSWHPAPFPLEIPKRILGAVGSRVVCDPFSGSATVGVEALRSGRSYLGIDNHDE